MSRNLYIGLLVNFLTYVHHEFVLPYKRFSRVKYIRYYSLIFRKKLKRICPYIHVVCRLPYLICSEGNILLTTPQYA